MTTDHRAGSARRIPQLIPHRLLRSKAAHHPAVLEEAERRDRNFQLRLADRITTFAGSMNFAGFTPRYSPSGCCSWRKARTLVDSRRVARGDLPFDVRDDRPEPTGGVPAGQGSHDFEAQDLELKTNTDLTRQIHLLTVELHRRLIDRPASDLPDRARKPSFEVMVIRARPHQD